MSRFLACAAKSLECETSYKQPVGGPYVRLRPGHRDPRIDGKPDGLAFDADPHDTGGRTCLGVIQREYDAYRAHIGQPTQDVWNIDDEEVNHILRINYWDSCGCEGLPAGPDLAVFDSAFNCGPIMAIKFLQRALGITADGHFGLATAAALKDVDAHDLVEGIISEREKYHRACRTAKYHLKGWLERDNATEHQALAMLGTPTPPPDLTVVAQNSARATPPPAVETVAETATGQSAVGSGSMGGGLTLVGGLSLYNDAKSNGLLDPANLKWFALLIAGVALVALARRDWIDRGRKLIMGV